jgi:TPR repeat protein
MTLCVISAKGRLALSAFLLLQLSMTAKAQESSSWSSGTMVAPGQRAGDVKIIKVDPSRKQQPKPVLQPNPVIGTAAHKFTPPVAPQPGAVPQVPGSAVKALGQGSISVAKTAAAQGEDAAYEAFDQGKYITALDLALKAAEKNDPQAHTLAGRIYQEGLGVSRDALLAAQWYRRGAELGDVEAMFAFGVMLADGDGIQKDRAGAGKMFDEAARRGHVLANYNLALLFLKGDGKPESPHRAALHLQYAAENGIAAAQYDLATLYATGVGVEPSAFTASEWLGRAADAGYPDAEVEYGVWLFQGRGVMPSQSRGALYFRSAAEKGVAVAQNRLARCYAHGAGVSADLGEAAKWHAIAKAGGVEDPGLDQLLGKLSRAERQKAQAAAEAWLDKSKVQ